MKLQSAFLPLVIGGVGFSSALLLNLALPNFQVQSIPLLPTAMYFAVSVGLYLNVSDIEITELLKNGRAIALVLLIGVPLKILLPGLALSALMPALGTVAVFLCATVIAQIDPILAAKNIDPKRFSQKSGTILRCWSSFDDPITVLFAFYIFLPLSLNEQTQYIGRYVAELGLEISVCLGLVWLLNVQRRLFLLQTDRIRRMVVIATCVASGLAARFLLPASLGLMADPFSARTKEKILNWIFGFSSFVIGALATDVPLKVQAGVALGAATFFVAQPLVALLFIRDSKANLLRVMFGHQNGMTAILLTIALELQLENVQLLSITLPAIVAIAVFYATVNYWLDRRLASA